MASISRRKKQFLAASGVWALVLLAFSLQPGWISNRFLPREYLHPIAHVAAYGIFSYLTSFYLRFERKFASFRMTDVKIALLTFFFCLAWGGATEWVQLYIPQRYADWKDLVWDVIGIVLGSAWFFLRDKLRLVRDGK